MMMRCGVNSDDRAQKAGNNGLMTPEQCPARHNTDRVAETTGRVPLE